MTPQNRTWRLIGVPIDCVGLPGGTELAPTALRDAGLVSATGVEDLGDTDIRLTTPDRDPDTGVVAHTDVVAMTREVRSRVAAAGDADHPLLVIGGCCTLLPAVVGGIRQTGADVGLVYFDGHIDLYDGTTSPTGEAADMPLAVLLGHGPASWQDAAGPGAQLQPTDVTLLGPRDEDEARSLGSLLPQDFPGLTYLDAERIREQAYHDLGSSIAEHVSRTNADGFWVHLDLDVLDEAVFPATDYLSPGGLDWATLIAAMAPLVGHPACRGLNIACYNPEKDASGDEARNLVAVVSELIG